MLCVFAIRGVLCVCLSSSFLDLLRGHVTLVFFSSGQSDPQVASRLVNTWTICGCLVILCYQTMEVSL